MFLLVFKVTATEYIMTEITTGMPCELHENLQWAVYCIQCVMEPGVERRGWHSDDQGMHFQAPGTILCAGC